MRDTYPPDDESERLARRPGPTLDRRGLTLLFVLVLFCPIAAVTLLYLILPSAHDRSLPVTASLMSKPGEPPSLRLKNVGEDPLHNLRIELNGAFAYFPHEPLSPNEQVDLSLPWFMKKTGQHLQPEQTDIRTIHISARLPGNQRAVFVKTLTQTE